MNLLIIGIGYVGLVTGICLSEMGHTVTCLDINETKIKQLNNGQVPIYEPGLEEMLKRNKATSRLKFTTDYAQAVSEADVLFICVDTPVADDGSANLNSLTRVVKAIAKETNGYKVIVNKSTVPPGTARYVKELMTEEMKKRGVAYPFDVVSNPEFLKEGNAIQDFMKPDRIVVGTDSEQALEIMKEIYAPFHHNHERLIEMDLLSSEVTKYAANAMLATRISFMNEMACFCEKAGADINKVRKGIGSDPRIGYHYLYPGPGYGGSCLPKDVSAIRSSAKAYGLEMPLISAVVEVNERQKEHFGNQIATYYGGDLEGITLAVLGLSFKPDTDDMRDAPSLTLIPQLVKQGASVRLFDPIAMENAKKLFPDTPQITWCQNESDAACQTDGVILLTEWKQFRQLNWKEIGKSLRQKVLFDARNQYEPAKMEETGFDYISIGRPALIHMKVTH